MTARQVFEATLIELSKVQAPSLKLYEFNYLFNKAINQYINKVYNVYDINQQTTDDLRVLKATAFLTPHKVNPKNNALMRKWKEGGESDTTPSGIVPKLGYDDSTADSSYAENMKGAASSYLSKVHTQIQSLHGATYEVYLPIDYLHMLNCVCIYYVAKQKDCWDAGSYIEVPAIRLTADSWSQIVTDIYNRPSPMRPYYYVHNMNTNEKVPTNPVTANSNLPAGFDGIDMPITPYEVKYAEDNGGSNFQRTFTLNDGNSTKEVSLVEKPTAVRFGNTSNVRCEIRYGKDDSLFQLAEVQIDYVKCPQFIRLTQEQIDLTEDTSQIMEFPDYVNQEITNELVHLVMERVNDPRLGNNMQMTQTIARPTGQQQAPTQAAQG